MKKLLSCTHIKRMKIMLLYFFMVLQGAGSVYANAEYSYVKDSSAESNLGRAGAVENNGVKDTGINNFDEAKSSVYFMILAGGSVSSRSR